MLSFNKILRKKEFATKMIFYNWTWWSESSGYDRDVNEVSSPTVDWHLLVDRNVTESGFNVIWRSCFKAGTLRNTVPWMPKYSSTLNCWNLNWTNSMLIECLRIGNYRDFDPLFPGPTPTISKFTRISQIPCRDSRDLNNLISQICERITVFEQENCKTRKISGI